MIEPKEAITAFEKQLKNSIIDFHNISVELLIDQQLTFYKKIRAKNVSYENDGDMILFQWGTYDWGEGKYFQFDIARQFIETDKNGDDAISQFHTILFYDPNSIGEEIQGNKWFNNYKNTDEIKIFILQSDIYERIKSLKPIKREISWEYQ